MRDRPREVLNATRDPLAQRRAPGDREISGRRAFFVGIGGCGMSGLAREFISRGASVAGVDAVRSATTAALEREGLTIGDDSPGVSAPAGCDLVVISAAVPPDHPAVVAARSAGVPVWTYAQALGRCMAGRTGVAIAGTHGKSTTAAMLAIALVEAGLDPSVIVGADVPQLARPGSPAVGHRVGAATVPLGPCAGEPGVFIAEACEFNRSFHNLRPTIASIGSVEADHLDIYGTLDAVIEAYAEFAGLLPDATDGGRLIIGHEGAHRRVVAAGLACAVETIGFAPEADWRIESRDARSATLSKRGEPALAWTNPLPGEHNLYNAAIAGAIALSLGADAGRVSASLTNFRGVRRRCERLGDRRLPAGGSVRVYDDYGHHPTEVDSTLRAIRAFERIDDTGGRLVCVFQPHQHSRTRFLLDEFAQSFERADLVIVPDIYFVRDSEIEKTLVSAAGLVDRLRERGVAAMHVYPFGAIVEQLDIALRDGDTLVVMGAGPVWKIAHGFMANEPRAEAVA